MINKIAILFFSFFLLSVAKADAPIPLPAGQAFVFSAEMAGPAQLVVQWQIAPGYFLYRDKLHLRALPANPQRLGPIAWPASKTQLDPTGSTYRAYAGVLHISLPLKGRSHEPLTLEVQYQGCSEAGFCYAPVKKRLHLRYPFAGEGLAEAPLLTISDVPKAELPVEKIATAQQSLLTEEQALLTDQSATQAFLGGHGFLMTLLCFLGLGLLLAFTPCSLPMIPILSSIIVGRQNLTTRKAVYLSLLYVLGMALTYAAAGMLIAWLGSSVQAYFQNSLVITAFSALFVLLALSMLGLFTLRLPSRLQQRLAGWQQQQQGGNYLSVFLMGCLATLIVSPCVTAPLVGVLAYITDTGDLVLGGSALFALGLGMGLPLLLLGFSAGRYLPKAGPWMDVITKLFAFLLLGMAVWMLTRILPGELTLFLWAALFITVAMYFLFFMEEFSRRSRYFAYLAGSLFIAYGFVLFIGVALGHTSPFYPFERLALEQSASDSSARPRSLDFVTVKSMAQLNTILEKAKGENKPVLLDFYAEWCESCKALEKAVLREAGVQTTLRHFTLLRANVTDNNVFDQALLKRYHVIAPPTFVFFNREGQELKEKRIVGEVDRRLFLARANTI